ncbi:hypothetical protein ACVPOQ_07255 [Staphylococcus aureus]
MALSSVVFTMHRTLMDQYHAVKMPRFLNNEGFVGDSDRCDLAL